MSNKNTTTDIIGGCLVWGGIGIMIGLRAISEHFPYWGNTPFITAVAMMAAGFTLWQWKQNGFRFEAESIPPLLIVFGSLILFVLFIALNMQVCRWRLGGAEMSIRWLPTMLSQLFVIGIAIFVHMAGFPPGQRRGSPGRTGGAIIVSAALAVGLNYLFDSRIGDLTTTLRHTQRCYPGGTCYGVGLEAWGGSGASILLGINLLQGLLILNALYGGFVLLKTWKSRGATS